MTLDNGGAYAIRGFNFQKASIISVIIDNYNKDGFTLLVETEDDFVIMYDEYKAFIQCKNQKLSIANLIKDQKKNKKVIPSILYKNLSIGTPEDVHKVFSRDFIEKEKKMLELRVPGEICGNVYHFNKEQRDKVVELLIESLADVEKRLENFKLYFPPFPNDLVDIVIYLTGKLNYKGINIDRNRGREIIAEISLMIDQKSEVILSDTSQIHLKELSQDYINKTFVQTVELITFDDILNRLQYPTMFIAKVKAEQLKIELMYKTIKIEVENWLDGINIEMKPDKEIINEVLNKFEGVAEKSTLVAIVIEIISSKGSEFFGSTIPRDI